MPALVRLSKKELKELIEKIEEPGCDITGLKNLLAQIEEEERLEKAARRGVPPEAKPEEISIEEHIEAIRQQSYIEQGKDLECMVCHEKFDHLISGTCENCFRQWALSIKRR